MIPSSRHWPRCNTGPPIALALLAVYLIWGSTYLGIRFALEGGYPPLLMAGGRFLLAGALMYAVLRARGVPAPTRRSGTTSPLMGLLLLGGGNGMVTIARADGVVGPRRGGGGLDAAVDGGVRRRAQGQHPNRLEWLGLAIGFVGVLWLNAGSSLTATPQGLVAAADRADRVVVRLGVEPRPRPAVAVHGRGGADALRRRADADRRVRVR